MRSPFALLTAFLPTISAATLEIILPATTALQNPNTLPSSSRAQLSSSGNALLSVPLSKSNSFLFTDVPSGSYLLSVHSRDVAFENLRVDVTNDGEGGEEVVSAWTTWRGNEWANKGEVRGEGRGSGVVRIECRAVWGKEFYQQRASCKCLDRRREKDWD
jgi:ER membrane protein complex subunit 7